MTAGVSRDRPPGPATKKEGAPAEADAPEGILHNTGEGQKVTVASFEQVEVPASHTW